ncbi:hypothetical protein HW132_35405 [Brasilonema sp. CT11]|nr:hypothetical protein [Brasilonema sp. CT11]
MTENQSFDNRSNEENATIGEKLEPGLVKTSFDKIRRLLGVAEENPMNRWMDTFAPFLKRGGKPGAIILTLGCVSLPLMLSGSPWVAPILAIGASLTAVFSCWK